MTLTFLFFFFQAEDGIRDKLVTGVQTCALPICRRRSRSPEAGGGARGRCVPPARAGRAPRPTSRGGKAPRAAPARPGSPSRAARAGSGPATRDRKSVV